MDSLVSSPPLPYSSTIVWTNYKEDKKMTDDMLDMSFDGYVLLCGDAVEKLRQIPDESVQCVVTSPPYYNLREYGTAKWEGGDPICNHKDARDRFSYPVSEKQKSNNGSAGH